MLSTAGTAFAAVPIVHPTKPHAYWTFERVASALGTGLSAPLPLAGVCTDTRHLERGDVFVALTGERFDAHDFLAEARDRGAAAVVVSDPRKAAGLGIPVYVVSDTLRALGCLGAAWRRAWGGTVLAVAGSNGKTSTKELLKAAFEKTFVVHATSGNFNNLVGVPLTLLAIPPAAQVAVVEVGTNAPGEIAQLQAIACPDIAVLTSIGAEHLEGLGDLPGVLREESDVFEGVQLAIVNAAFPDAVSIARKRAISVISVGLGGTHISSTEVAEASDEVDGDDADGAHHRAGANAAASAVADIVSNAWGLDAEGRVWLNVGGVRATLPVRGEHQAANAMLAYAAATSCGIAPEVAFSGMIAMTVPKMRTEWMSFGAATVINDAYNANPPSVIAALGLLSQVGAGRQRVAFLGTMLELGTQSESQHDEVARAALEYPVDLIVAIGQFADSFRRVAEEAMIDLSARVICVDEVEQAWPLAQPKIERDATILLKASRGLRLERLLSDLTTWAQY